ncbi:MAG: cytochrome C biogenesis protein [Candidatus Riflebacteria bacterium HGW-Riflebacteria-1]|jgi:cytochrome c biogenesis protein CcdA|nr:MAG: cytochrome C biogenesis protein [Candidatus Riflebacteria bacterium HGW-Riflebacteria-1]
MDWVSISSAAWLGILTAISPCPLASNIAAISFIGRQLHSKTAILSSGLLYTAGRTVTYVVLGALLASGLLASGEISRFLQKYLNEILGPLLIILGMILLNMIGGGVSINMAGEGIQKKAQQQGMLYAFPLGVLFALSFCPVSAGLFFGGLVPLAAGANSTLLLPLIYGIGTAVPVVVFAFLIAFGSQWLGKAFNSLNKIEFFVRTATGIIFILVGFYYSLAHVYGIVLFT